MRRPGEKNLAPGNRQPSSSLRCHAFNGMRLKRHDAEKELEYEDDVNDEGCSTDVDLTAVTKPLLLL